jgi:2-polyprenyl-6-methoxyphenol hydroxylase-like FAD-dependent oxidoreductase
MAYPADLNIIIIGGSLAGLFTGVIIKGLPNVASVTILERYQATELQDLGAGLRINDEASDTILEYTGQPLEKYAIPVEQFRFIGKDGRIDGSQPGLGAMTTWAQVYRILRRSFDADPKCIYRHGCTLENVVEEDISTLKVAYRDESGQKVSAVADIVIGADGASSKARLLMTPDATRTSVGYVLYRGVLRYSDVSKSSAEIFGDATTFHWAPASQLISFIMPGAGGPADESGRLVNWVWYQKKSDEAIKKLLRDKRGVQHKFALPAGGMVKDEVLKIKEQAKRELPAAHAEVIAKTSEPFVQVITDSSGGSNVFLNGKLLLVGDAVGGQRYDFIAFRPF